MQKFLSDLFKKFFFHFLFLCIFTHCLRFVHNLFIINDYTKIIERNTTNGIHVMVFHYTHR